MYGVLRFTRQVYTIYYYIRALYILRSTVRILRLATGSRGGAQIGGGVRR